MTITIGLNIFHADSAACIFSDSDLLFAIEEERLNRQKHWAGIPLAAIQACLDFVDVNFEQIDYLAVNYDRQAHFSKKLLFALKNPSLIISNTMKLINRRKQNGLIKCLEDHFGADFRGELVYCEHHHAHHLSSIIDSTISDAALVSVDGFGDFTSTSIGKLQGNETTDISKVFFPHSLGIFYQAVTQILGFENYGDEYKVMGLSAYGEPAYVNELEKIIFMTEGGQFELNLSYFEHHKHGNSFSIIEGIPLVKTLFSKNLEDLLIKKRQPWEPIEKVHKDIAASAQVVYEKIFISLLNFSWQKTRVPTVCISGGCAMNSLANGKIVQNTNFKNVIIPPSPGDSGGAVGAAINALKLKTASTRKPTNLQNPYYGGLAKRKEIEKIVKKASKVFSTNQVLITEHSSFEQTAIKTAEMLAQGCVVGWFQGRSEWGPRALGNRSILADPRNPDIKELLNSKIKRREGFRPFAPSILADYQSDWFDSDASVPFMSQVFNVKKLKRKQVPGVVHQDGTGRLQTVLKTVNPKYYMLISEFFKLTGVPLILNTSFNENEPIVESPFEAFAVFERTNMDFLVIENTSFERV